MRTVRRIATAIVFATLLTAQATWHVAAQPSASTNAGAGAGSFQLFKFLQRIGEERYQLTRADDDLVLESTFWFTDRGTAVPLTTELRLGQDLTPRAFSIHGRTSRLTTIDRDIAVGDSTASIRDDGQARDVPLPKEFFTAAGYAPVSVQMLLVRYMRERRLNQVALIPEGMVHLDSRGRQSVRVDGRSVALERYSLDGLLWGRETLWLTPDGELAALVSIDAEFDHFEAVRPGYEGVLGTLVASAARDGMQLLAEQARQSMPPQPRAVAITGATLIDGTGAVPVPDATILVERGRISAAGPAGRVRIPAGAQVIEERGAYAIPGLWDMHAHFEQVEWGPIYLASGITTVRDCGNELEFIKSVRDTLAEGGGVGPRLLLAGIVDGDSPTALGVIRATTPEQARRVVRDYKAAKFDQIKVYSSVAADVLKALTKEAHRLRLSVTGHVPNGISTEAAVESGLDQINHIQYIRRMLLAADAAPDQAQGDAILPLDGAEARRKIQLLRDRRVVVDPTLALYELQTRPASTPTESFEPGITKVARELRQPLSSISAAPGQEAARRGVFDQYLQIVKALHDAGVPIVAGTDQSIPGYSLHRELELYVEAGFTPMEALQAATSVPARVMGREADSGTIAAGKRADLVVLSADPLADIHHTRDVKLVIAGGRVYRPEPLWRMAGFEP